MNLNIRTDWKDFTGHSRRKASLENYYGRNWQVGLDWARWKVAWIKITGELYAVEMNNVSSSGRRFIVLTILHQRSDVEKLLEGWDHPGSPIYRNLDELMERIQRKEAK